ncbi:hypothetical protein PhaeoP23_02020 [Phaeobacter piscinae]|uniref:DUF4231 domain-containing protein n=1 Tax=Phaeobacter piscinae TaxID=1580596 RepID=A0ABN5DGT3_9RHOB|nr:DUF4231 domain-containing protein [Phaeobacter piscinae]ATG36153.1 hypothetical protein PhaeoP36_02020 [Phaeobacter piscinae]AUQ86674.1 hypothetical protein PhaeoP42_02021 [Phaeobacter piscinae]AUR24557.1 hypothetical protein PhaeoP23_02020 [Phaeobacter piscinae]
MNSDDLPALYLSADLASNKSQKGYLLVLKAEFALLVLLALVGEFAGEIPAAKNVMVIFLIFLFGLLVYRFFSKLDRKWYACRALAESVKTSAWKFAMRSHPYDDHSIVQVPTKNFLNSLIEIRKDNDFLGHELDAKYSDGDQISDKMLEVRKLPFEERLDLYLSSRVKGQRTWYATKAADNAKKRKFWFCFAVFCYALASASMLSKDLIESDVSFLFSGLLVLVTSSFAWIQVKRFGELSASYTLTAHEIGSIQGRSVDVTDENSLSEFVNAAEFAFSREHTQWAARRDFS